MLFPHFHFWVTYPFNVTMKSKSTILYFMEYFIAYKCTFLSVHIIFFHYL